MAGNEKDPYQERYLAHLTRKETSLTPTVGDPKCIAHTEEDWARYINLQQERRTQRTFNGLPIKKEQINRLAEAIVLCPSSCNRQAIVIKMILEYEEKELLSGLLVGGVGWSHRADKILLLFADMTAYKSPAERDFMPYLDAGVMIKTIYDACEVLNIGAGYVNPNIRGANKDFFQQRFGAKNLRFCGAMALGNYDLKAKESPKRSPHEVWIT